MTRRYEPFSCSFSWLWSADRPRPQFGILHFIREAEAVGDRSGSRGSPNSVHRTDVASRGALATAAVLQYRPIRGYCAGACHQGARIIPGPRTHCNDPDRSKSSIQEHGAPLPRRLARPDYLSDNVDIGGGGGDYRLRSRSHTAQASGKDRSRTRT